ncbi:MAG: ISAzo13-like element transposase-related protein [Pseudonocardiaceae bacterium]
MEPETRATPESSLRWTTKPTRNLAAELTKMGDAVSHAMVAEILHCRRSETWPTESAAP